MKREKIKSSFYKRLLGIFGAAGFLVTFQACYGTPQNYISVDGKVTDKESGEGIKGIEVNIVSDSDSITLTTDSTGYFYSGMVSENHNLQIKINDVDGDTNGVYTSLDSTLTHTSGIIDIKLNQTN